MSGPTSNSNYKGKNAFKSISGESSQANVDPTKYVVAGTTLGNKEQAKQAQLNQKRTWPGEYDSLTSYQAKAEVVQDAGRKDKGVVSEADTSTGRWKKVDAKDPRA